MHPPGTYINQEPGEAVKRINAWAAAATNDLIDSILADGQVSAETDVVVANAVYFKGSTFHVPFMRGFGQQYIACHRGFKVLKLRYKEGRKRPSPFSMCIFLPDARDGLHALVEMMASCPEFIGSHLPTSLVPVGKLRLPRFKLAFSADMSGILRELGLEVAFDENEADLSDMVEDDGTGRPLGLSGIIHKAVIEVNEDGTKAAAVTASMMFLPGKTAFPDPVWNNGGMAVLCTPPKFPKMEN
uniref:Serpin domain-containing protein n=1 Tax=Aegilops tauschii TaxID=37682 RepID=M8C4A9_AEGTA